MVGKIQVQKDNVLEIKLHNTGGIM